MSSKRSRRRRRGKRLEAQKRREKETKRLWCKLTKQDKIIEHPEPIIMPIIRKFAQLSADELVSVQPMHLPEMIMSGNTTTEFTVKYDRKRQTSKERAAK